jgi:hypothetical protein
LWLTTSSLMAEAWAVPPMPLDAFLEQPDAVWRCVERELIRDGWAGKCRDAIRLSLHDVPRSDGPLGHGWLTFEVAKIANELGAPVQQIFTACTIRSRGEV